MDSRAHVDDPSLCEDVYITILGFLRLPNKNPKPFVMPKRNNKRNNRARRGRNQQASILREYAAPVLRKIERPHTDVTLYATVTVDSGITGTNGITGTISYSQFSDIQEFVGVYKYFEILGYKQDFSLATTTAARDSYIASAVALRPFNYVLGELATSTVPNGHQMVMDLPGAIFVQEGFNNRGKWNPPTCKQVFSVRDAITNVRPALDWITYNADIGPSENIGIISIAMNFRFYGKEYSGTL